MGTLGDALHARVNAQVYYYGSVLRLHMTLYFNAVSVESPHLIIIHDVNARSLPAIRGDNKTISDTAPGTFAFNALRRHRATGVGAYKSSPTLAADSEIDFSIADHPLEVLFTANVFAILVGDWKLKHGEYTLERR